MSELRSENPPAIRLVNVSRHFGAVAALKDISLELAPGLVHALIGQNGAGKSTCLGIIAGRTSASSGRIELFGRSLPNAMTPELARRAGISTIYQELSIVPAMRAVDNVFLCNLGAGLGLVDDARLRRRYRELCNRLGISIPAGARAGDLSIADQQMLEIMRALSSDCRVLLLDEPTAALSQRERDALFSVVRDLRSQGVTLVFVSHHLDEVEKHSDTVTVFRDGRLIETGPTSGWTRGRMVGAMLGEELLRFERAAEKEHKTPGQGQLQAPEVLRVEGLSSRNGVQDIDLVVRAGEVVGIGGLVGSGRTSLLKALTGAAEGLSGRMWVDGKPVPLPRTPHQARTLGLSLVPEDRKNDGLFLAMSSRDNMLMGNGRSIARLGFVQRDLFHSKTVELARQYDVADRFLDRLARELSGGNQQKLLLARAAGSGNTRLLLADEATRGIDVGAKSTILKTLRQLASKGLTIIFVSSDLEEVVAISDRVYVLSDGRIAGHLDGTTKITEDRILSIAFNMETASHA